MCRDVRATLVCVVLLSLITGPGTVGSVRAAERVTETYRLEVLGTAPPGQAFVAVYSHFVGDGRLPGLQSPPRGGGYNISTWVVLCGTVSKSAYEVRERDLGYALWGSRIPWWPVRQVLGNGERECRGDGSVYTRTITIPSNQQHSFGFLHVAGNETEFFAQKQRDRSYTGGGTRTAYYDFGIGAGRVGGRPGLADRRFKAEVTIELRGRAPRNVWGQEYIGEQWGNICLPSGYKAKTDTEGPFKLPRCAGTFHRQEDRSAEGFPPGTRLTYALITSSVRDKTYTPSYADCPPGPRKLVCAGTTLDSDVSITLWYDFDRGEGGSKVVRHPYTVPSAMPKTGAGGMTGVPVGALAAVSASLVAVMYGTLRRIQ